MSPLNSRAMIFEKCYSRFIPHLLAVFFFSICSHFQNTLVPDTCLIVSHCALLKARWEHYFYSNCYLYAILGNIWSPPASHDPGTWPALIKKKRRTSEQRLLFVLWIKQVINSASTQFWGGRKVIIKREGKELLSSFLIIHSRNIFFWIETAPLDTSCTFMWILIYFSLSEFR